MQRNQLLNDQFMKQSVREAQVNQQYNSILKEFQDLQAKFQEGQSEISNY